MKTKKESPTPDDAYLYVKEGDILTCDVITWQAGYEFGRPCLMLSPVVREDSDSHPEALAEDFLLDIVVDGRAQLNREEDQIAWRGWNLKILRRRFNEALKGKKWPVVGYKAFRQKVRITRDKDGLNWEPI